MNAQLKLISKMEFNCKLAHADQVKKISGFNSIKELYERVSQTFPVSINEILFCTLNTHDFRDMNSLLCNYLSLGDLIVIHICGSAKDLTIEKTQRYLGLTITDNGHGRAFVKKVDSDQDFIKQLIRPGDHIASINSESTIGMRHYEVAKSLRDLPPNTTFRIQLVEPLYSEGYLSKTSNVDLTDCRLSLTLIGHNDASNNQIQTSHGSPINNQSANLESLNSLYEDLAKSSLPIDKLLSKSIHQDTAIIDNDNLSDYKRTIDRINQVLETFVGINDNVLAIQIYRLAKENTSSFDNFENAIDKSELASFKFDKAIEFSLWSAAIGSR